jgi:signal transduction histidine kinase
MGAAGESGGAAFPLRHGAGTLDGAGRMAENPLVDRLRALLLADDGERRMFERALHDGIQQQLIALAVDLQLLRGLVETDPQGAAGLLDGVRAGVARALDELGGLAQRIHPPLLDTQGLVAALRMAAAAAPIPAQVEGSVEAGVAPEVAVTVYRCCVATLAAAQGAPDPRATVTVRSGGGMLEFAVELARARVDAGALDGLAGRVHVLGGTLEVAPSRVAGRLPVRS